ncbi:TRAP transporter small permease [Oceanobacillus saliphilus]|uniref:TRAP transporter small permease n=1 Tax=Oceanobacillus saliphilus TaxID=2925834 RepID=UPI00201D6485|nr:TRAP transporter small permease [Oceanobacillus saliphilus]
MGKAFANFNKILQIICNVLLILMTVIVTYVVFMRYVMNATPVWGEEMVRMFLVWMTFLGASLGLRDETHIRLNAIDGILSPTMRKVMDWFAVIVLFLFSLFMVIEGTKMTILSMGSRMPGLGIETAWLVAVFPLSGLLNMIQLIHKGGQIK